MNDAEVALLEVAHMSLGTRGPRSETERFAIGRLIKKMMGEGREEHGPWCPHDGRDLGIEAADEQADAWFYACARVLETDGEERDAWMTAAALCAEALKAVEAARRYLH